MGNEEQHVVNKILNIIVFTIFIVVSYCVFVNYLDVGKLNAQQARTEVALKEITESQKLMNIKLDMILSRDK